MAVINWLPKPINGNDDNGMEAPLKAVDIRDTLNHYGGKVTNDTTSYFTTDANINRWSKHKPFVTGFIGDEFLRYDSEKWNKQTGTIPKVYMNSNLQYEPALIEVWNGCSEDEWFQYELPSGGELEPLRMGDFRGYRADATSPFKSFSCDSTEIEPVNGTANFTLNMRYYLNDENAQADGGMLSLRDIAMDLNNNEYFVLLVAKVKLDTGGTYYKAWTGASTKDANWGELTASIDIGKINTTNAGIYEFAVGLTDKHSYHVKLPFKRITLKAEVYYPHDTMFGIWGDAYLNSVGSNSYVNLNVDYLLGKFDNNDNLRTEPENRTIQFYIGPSENDCNTIFAGQAITETLEPGERKTFSITVKESEYTAFYQIKDILQTCVENGVVWVTANGANPTSIPLTGN